MKTTLTALIVLCASLAAAAVAHAGVVPVGVYSFQSTGDVAAFQKLAGGACTKKWYQQKAMAVTLGAKTNFCSMRTSVVGDSTDPLSDMQISAAAQLGPGVSGKLRTKAYVGVAARASETAGWELRVRPAAQTWQLFRDPKGAPGPALVKSGKGKFIKTGATTKKTRATATAKPAATANQILLRTFDLNTPTTTVLAQINGQAVITLSDAAPDSPDGRRSAVTTGVKGTGFGTGVVGIFDNVAISVPSPF
jgi:hypothetical protein